MARVPPYLLASAVHFFNTEEDASAGESGWGGSGFLLGLRGQSKETEFMEHLFLVTARHVVGQPGNPNWIRRTMDEQNTNYTIPLVVRAERIDFEQWYFHPAGDDLAICHLGFVRQRQMNGYYIPAYRIYEKGKPYYSVAAGDDVFTAGRLLRRDHLNRDISHPCARFGHVANSDTKPIYNEHIQGSQESFLIEMLSTNGMSGSPVFVYRPPGEQVPGLVRPLGVVSPDKGSGPWLLGINWCHLNTRVPITIDEIETQVVMSSHIAAVVPAWKITETINQGEVLAQMAQVEEAFMVDR